MVRSTPHGIHNLGDIRHTFHMHTQQARRPEDIYFNGMSMLSLCRRGGDEPREWYAWSSVSCDLFTYLVNCSQTTALLIPIPSSLCTVLIVSRGRSYELLSTSRKQEIDSLRASHLTYRLHQFSLVRRYICYSLSLFCGDISTHIKL